MKAIADLILEHRVAIAVIFVLGWIQSNIRIDGLRRELDNLKRRN
jgi:hypothetical protein